MNAKKPNKTPADWSWFDKGDIESAIKTCDELLKVGVFSGVYPSSVERSVLTLLLINLNDLLQKMDSVGHRFQATNDLLPEGRAEDVTSLINNARNAACHLNSGNHLLDKNKISHCVMRGYAPHAFWINGVQIGCDYADDAAFVFGHNRVYLKRHVSNALEAARAFFAVHVQR